ncbi:MAG TPA: TrkA C-terminal domain-containing protein [Thermoleophilaceae bacterium]|nr:TrkA C-terminal domain-containing protein [Thermoleophilaceae bacterium]
MLALVSVFVAVILSLLITRVATVALTLTGLSRESARFQARSALSGAGFTTNESEAVVNHPVRRRIVMFLMLVGSAGIVTVIGTVVLSFANAAPGERASRLAVLLGGLLLLWLVARSGKVDRYLSGVIGRLLGRWTDLDVRDYAELLHLAQEYSVMEVGVQPGDWVAGRSLDELRLRDEGVVLLGISRADGEYVGVPQFDTRIRTGDTLLMYGRSPRLAELDCRPAGPEGDAAHESAVVEEQSLIREQAERDRDPDGGGSPAALESRSERRP